MKSDVKQCERSSQIAIYLLCYVNFRFYIGVPFVFELFLKKIIYEYLHYNFELSQSSRNTPVTNTGEMGAELSEFMIYFLNIAAGFYV